MIYSIGRGAFHLPRSPLVMAGGADGKANVGISNDKGGENPPRRKAEVSRAMPVIPGSVGP